VNAGVVDELVLSVAPTLLAGKRLFDGIDPNAVGLEIIDVLASSKVTHLRYAVQKKR
jgi:dihydrofolate reductase